MWGHLGAVCVNRISVFCGTFLSEPKEQRHQAKLRKDAQKDAVEAERQKHLLEQALAEAMRSNDRVAQMQLAIDKSSSARAILAALDEATRIHSAHDELSREHTALLIAFHDLSRSFNELKLAAIRSNSEQKSESAGLNESERTGDGNLSNWKVGERDGT